MSILCGYTDLTMTQYGSVDVWLGNVRTKFGDRFASRCAELMGDGTLENGHGHRVMEQVIREQQPLLSRDALIYHIIETYGPELASIISAGKIPEHVTPAKALSIINIALLNCGQTCSPSPYYLRLYAWNGEFGPRPSPQ